MNLYSHISGRLDSWRPVSAPFPASGNLQTLAEENRSIASDVPEGRPLTGSDQFKNLVASYTESPDSEPIQFGAGGKELLLQT